MSKAITTVFLLAPSLALADKYGIDEAMSDRGAPGGIGQVFVSILIGAAIGFVFSKIYNASHQEKIASDGCAIIGGLAGMLIGPLLMIVVR